MGHVGLSKTTKDKVLYESDVELREDRPEETLRAVRAVHPYEEPLINVILLAEL